MREPWCDAVIPAIGDFETGLLCFSILQQPAIRRTIVTAPTSTHERILGRPGIKEIVMPEVEAAEGTGPTMGCRVSGLRIPCRKPGDSWTLSEANYYSTIGPETA